jgi:hypothetical protein
VPPPGRGPARARRRGSGFGARRKDSPRLRWSPSRTEGEPHHALFRLRRTELPVLRRSRALDRRIVHPRWARPSVESRRGRRDERGFVPRGARFRRTCSVWVKTRASGTCGRNAGLPRNPVERVRSGPQQEPGRARRHPRWPMSMPSPRSISTTC